MPIAYLNREKKRYERSRDLLMDAEDGRIELWAPAVLLVEVVRWSREVDPADPDARKKLEDFLGSPWLNVAEVDRRMADIARDVVATTPVRTGVDALYVATAAIVGASVVYTWDDGLMAMEYEGVRGQQPPGSLAPKLEFIDGE